MNRITKENGITLIALVVTIIILLILAGVTVGMSTTGTGLFDKAKYATELYNNKAIEEQGILENLYNEIEIGTSARDNSFANSSTLLWTNPNPENNFPATQTIELDLSNYYGVAILCKETTSVCNHPYIFNIQKVYEEQSTDLITIYANGTQMYRQGYALKTGIYFTSMSNSSYQNKCIPMYIYGITDKSLVDTAYTN